MTTRVRTTTPSALPALRLGLATSVLLAVAALVDLLVVGSLASHSAALYAPYGVAWEGAAATLATSLVGLGVLGSVGWWAVARGARQRRAWAAPAGTVLFVVGLLTGLGLLTAREYGQMLLPPWLAVLELLPAVVGAVATVALWRDR